VTDTVRSVVRGKSPARKSSREWQRIGSWEGRRRCKARAEGGEAWGELSTLYETSVGATPGLGLGAFSLCLDGRM